MLFTMFVYFILWAISNSKNNERNLETLKEVCLNYKSLIEGYKKTWTFDDFEMKSKANKKLSFDMYYNTGDYEKVNNAFSFWTLISWFILIAIWDILVWNILPRVINPILSVFNQAGITNDAIGAIAFLVPTLYVIFIAFIKPRFGKDTENTRAKMMSKDLYEIELALQKHHDATLVSRTAAELRVSDEKPVNIVIDGDVVGGKQIIGDAVLDNGKIQKKD